MPSVKFIEVDSICVPDQWRPDPYLDKFSLWIDNEFVRGSPFPGRAAPDPFVWDDQAKLWRQAFGFAAPGEYPWECWNSPKHGKCLMLEPLPDGTGGLIGGPVATRYPDANNGGQWIARSVEVHTGFKVTWAGSKCCLTISPVVADEWWANFQIHDSGLLRIIDASQPLEMPAVEVTA